MAVDAHAESETRPVAEERAAYGLANALPFLAADAIALALATIGADESLASAAGPREWTTHFVIVLPLWIATGFAYRLYEDEPDAAIGLTALPRLFQAATISVWLACTASWLLLRRGTVAPYVVLWALSLVLVPLLRQTARHGPWASRPQRTLIVGAGEVGQLVARKLMGRRASAVELVGLFDSDSRPLANDLKGLPIFGSASGLAHVVESLKVERVILTFSREPQESFVDLVRSLHRSVRVELVPGLHELVGPGATLDDVGGVRLISLPKPTYTRISRFGKRALDIFGAGVALVVLSPLLTYVACRIKRESPGPVFFRQTRLGKDMRPFTMLKFRSMYEGTDSRAHERAIAELMKAGVTPDHNHLFKVERTDAITPMGHWIRRTSIDELPQLINVLRGEMSLVGPRPCIPYEVKHFRPHHFERFEMPAGITGLWQATLRARATFSEALDLDVMYVRSWRLRLDLALLLRTAVELLRRETQTA